MSIVEGFNDLSAKLAPANLDHREILEIYVIHLLNNYRALYYDWSKLPYTP